MRKLNILSKLQNIINKFTDICAIISTFIMNLIMTPIKLIISNPWHAIAAIATVVIAFYAFLTFGVQEKLKQLQDNFIAMQTEPRLTGTAGPYFFFELKKPYHYYLTNIGSDTAWSVFADMRSLILCDTIIIYNRLPLLPPLIKVPGTIRGGFSRWNPIAPAEENEFGCDKVGEDFVKLSKMLGGIILLEADFVYWSDSPIKQYEELEYFIYNKMKPSFFNPCFEKLERPKDMLLCLLDSLKNTRKIAEVTWIRNIDRPVFYDDLFDLNSMLILSHPVTFIGPHDLQWNFRDTFIVLDSTIVSFQDYRRQFKEF